jgi:hypothetical protein
VIDSHRSYYLGGENLVVVGKPGEQFALLAIGGAFQVTG